MAKILKFDQVNESGWRDFIKRNKKYTTNDLYTTKAKSVERVNEPPKDKIIFGKQFQDLEHAKDLELGYLDEGVFRKTDDYFNQFRFGNWRSGDIWFDHGDIFDNLKNISINKLGLKVGQEVFIKSLNKNGTINKISPLVIYNIYNGVFEKGIEYVFTLAYKVDVTWYQATKIEVVGSTKPASIIDAEIEDNFLEFIDSGILTFTSKSEKIKDAVRYSCKINVSISNPEMLDKISSQLLVMTKRLSYKNIEVEIKSISLEGIAFTATQN